MQVDQECDTQQCSTEAQTSHVHHHACCVLHVTCVLTAGRSTKWMYHVTTYAFTHLVFLQPHQQAGGPHVEELQVPQELNGCIDVVGEPPSKKHKTRVLNDDEDVAHHMCVCANYICACVCVCE